MDNSQVEETIKVIRPTNNNHIWNTEAYDVIETTDVDGARLVILRSKVNET